MRADHENRNVSYNPLLPPGRGRALAGKMAVGLIIAGIALLPTLVGGVAATGPASAAQATVDLGTAAPFSVLAGAGVTNTGPTVLGGDLGTCPTPAISGFPPGVVNGTVHANDAEACQAQSDLTIAYDSAAARAPTASYTGAADLGGQTLTTGVYTSADSFAITGPLTLDAQQDPDAVFIFQAGSTLITETASSVELINGAQACNVFWQVATSATLGVASTFAGTVMALASITANTGATVDGRLLARNGAVTLDSNTVTAAACATGESSTSSTTLPSSTTTTTLPSTTTTTLGSSATTTTTLGSSATTTTTLGSSTTTTLGSSTTTLPSSATTTQPLSATTTAQAIGRSSTGSDSAFSGATTSSGPASDVLGAVADRIDPSGAAPEGTLAKTGSPVGTTLLLAVAALVLGGAAIRFGRERAMP